MLYTSLFMSSNTEVFDRANAYKKLLATFANYYSQSQHLVRQSSCHLSGETFPQKCNIGPLKSANCVSRKTPRKIERIMLAHVMVRYTKRQRMLLLKNPFYFYVSFFLRSCALLHIADMVYVASRTRQFCQKVTNFFYNFCSIFFFSLKSDEVGQNSSVPKNNEKFYNIFELRHTVCAGSLPGLDFSIFASFI